ncbi:hypothetical protein [Paenibacillus medicaginis]|uniref:Uncharacterized protein n=1 Tax=Paenibacillus medicaginis TaxID=1470560 RepID=A0ABV5C0R7_9BACL
MATEASAVTTGGFAYLDKHGFLHVVATEKTAKENTNGGVVEFEGQHAYGYPVVPAAAGEYEQLVIKADGTEKDGRTVPQHLLDLIERLK